jgi:hypothetical protein
MESKKSNEASGSVFFRALVMLGFLGVIFYAALSGNALPDSMRKKVEKFISRFSPSEKPSGPIQAPGAANADSEAPPFNAQASVPMAIGGTPTPQTPAAMQDNRAAPRQLTQDASARMLPGTSAEGMPSGVANQNISPVVPVNYQTPGETSTVTGAPFLQIQNRLKQLGATYFLLETWGNQQQLYRFYCTMAVGGNTNFVHHFEKTGPDPLQTMADVLREVEAWREGGSVMQ